MYEYVQIDKFTRDFQQRVKVIALTDTGIDCLSAKNRRLMQNVCMRMIR